MSTIDPFDNDFIDPFEDESVKDFSVERALINQLIGEIPDIDSRLEDYGSNFLAIDCDHGEITIEVRLDIDDVPEWIIHIGGAEMIRIQDIFISPKAYIDAADEFFKVIRNRRFKEPLT